MVTLYSERDHIQARDTMPYTISSLKRLEMGTEYELHISKKDCSETHIAQV